MITEEIIIDEDGKKWIRTTYDESEWATKQLQKWLKLEDYDGYKIFKIMKCEYCGAEDHDESENPCPKRVEDVAEYEGWGRETYPTLNQRVVGGNYTSQISGLDVAFGKLTKDFTEFEKSLDDPAAKVKEF
jgi:hypothetical protein